jgi:hypothetical protein
MIRMAFRAGRAGVLATLIVTTSAVVGAQPVLLQLKPRLGDTLHVTLTQQVEMTGFPPSCPDPRGASRTRATASAVACANVRTMNTAMEVFSRAIVKRSMRDATDMLAITDSVRTSTGKRGGAYREARQPTSRTPVEIRISSDGGVEIGAGPASDEIRTLFGQMPPTLSRKSVGAGEKWIHEMRVPLPNEPGATGRVRTTFQLDSLGRNGDIAYISMRGVLSHDHSDGSDSETTGSLAGTMLFDRRLAWITETHATIDVWSKVKSPPAGQPMHVHTKVVQSLRVSDAP